MEFEILKPNAFCHYKDKEVGIASAGYFASTKFLETEGDEYITEVAGSSFGWVDNLGDFYKDDKWSFKRPSEERIREELNKFPVLLEEAIAREIVKVIL